MSIPFMIPKIKISEEKFGACTTFDFCFLQ